MPAKSWKKPPQKVAYLWQLGGFFSAAPTAQNCTELHFYFINSFIQSSQLRSPFCTFVRESNNTKLLLTKVGQAEKNLSLQAKMEPNLFWSRIRDLTIFEIIQWFNRPDFGLSSFIHKISNFVSCTFLFL